MLFTIPIVDMDTMDSPTVTPKVVGCIEYTETVRDNDKVEIQEIWTVQEFKYEIKSAKSKVLHSPRYVETSSAECKFQLKIEFHQENQYTIWGIRPYEIQIYYMSPKQINLESIRLTVSGQDSTISHGTFVQSTPRLIEANKWHHLKQMWSYLHDGMLSWLDDYDNLRLQFEFVVSIEKENIENQFQIPPTQLTSDWENLFLEGLYSDIVMKSADDEEFRVHKAVLAKRCAVLKAHFEHNTTENITNIVKSHLDSAVLREVLLFIYTDKTPKLDEIPEKLLAAADYYQLSRLKSLCEEALYKKLTVDNAVETLQLADLYSANTLRRLSLAFIRQDYRQLKLITKTEGWAKLQSIDLLKKICE